jgi:acetolactate synthase-1/2/3 large subunit
MQRAFLRRADLIIGLGYDTIEVEYEAWTGGVPVLHIDIEAADTDGSVEIAGEVVGDLEATLARLNARPAAQNAWPPGAAAAHKQAFQAALRPAAAGFTPHQAIDIVRRVLPRDGILSFDVGAHTHQIAGQWTVHGPREFLITNGWSSMGFGLPAAIAAKIACPERPVVCIWLSLIRIKQGQRQYAPTGSELQAEPYRDPPAHYFGVPAHGVADPAALETALATALDAVGPTVIEAVVDPAHYMDTVFD